MEVEKQHIQEGLPDLLPWSRSQDPHVRGVLLYLEERDILISKTERYREESQRIGLAKISKLIMLSSYHLSCHFFFLKVSSLIKRSIKTLRFNHFLRSSFPYEGLRSCKAQMCVLFPFLICLLFTGGPRQELRLEENPIFLLSRTKEALAPGPFLTKALRWTPSKISA